ncbi:MAG: hypothetical protein GXY77_09810 [Fibrobacter sp.]|nr:hypothetical protein [Fibrobacter sp.]
MQAIILLLISLFPLTLHAQTREQSSNGWLWLLMIAVLLFYVAWTASRAQNLAAAGGQNEILKDLNEKYRNGEISKTEYDSRRKDLEI